MTIRRFLLRFCFVSASILNRRPSVSLSSRMRGDERKGEWKEKVNHCWPNHKFPNKMSSEQKTVADRFGRTIFALSSLMFLFVRLVENQMAQGGGQVKSGNTSCFTHYSALCTCTVLRIYSATQKTSFHFYINLWWKPIIFKSNFYLD